MIKSVENKKGLKVTSLGWIPEDWKILRLSDIGHTYTGLSGKNKDDFGTGQPYIPYLNIFNNTIIKDGEFDFVRIDINENQSKVEKGDIFFTTSSETPNEVGMCSAFCGETKDLYLNSFCFGFRISVHNKVSPIYLAHYFRSQIGRKIIYRLAQGATRYNLSKTSLLNQSFYIPTYPEQISIANILNRWDLCIDKIKENIKLNEKRKKALIQQLLTGKKRLKGFKDKWINVKICDIAKEINKRNGKNKEIIVLSCTKYDGLVPSLEYFGRKIYSDDLSTYKIVPKHTFAYATNHIEEGSIGYQESYDEALISPMYTVFKTNDNCNDDFIYKLLKTHRYIHEYNKRMEGSINRRGGLRWDEFSKIKLSLPSFEEQSAISNILKKAEKEIELLKRKLEFLKKQKQGLMQVLLTGKVRVK